jgi:hypothetical protein
MQASRSLLAQGTASGEDVERYEIIDGVRLCRAIATEPFRSFPDGSARY